MKGTTGFVLRACLFEWYSIIDNVYYVSAGQDIIDKALGYTAGHDRILALARILHQGGHQVRISF